MRKITCILLLAIAPVLLAQNYRAPQPQRPQVQPQEEVEKDNSTQHASFNYLKEQKTEVENRFKQQDERIEDTYHVFTLSLVIIGIILTILCVALAAVAGALNQRINDTKRNMERDTEDVKRLRLEVENQQHCLRRERKQIEESLQEMKQLEKSFYEQVSSHLEHFNGLISQIDDREEDLTLLKESLSIDFQALADKGKELSTLKNKLEEKLTQIDSKPAVEEFQIDAEEENEPEFEEMPPSMEPPVTEPDDVIPDIENAAEQQNEESEQTVPETAAEPEPEEQPETEINEEVEETPEQKSSQQDMPNLDEQMRKMRMQELYMKAVEAQYNFDYEQACEYFSALVALEPQHKAGYLSWGDTLAEEARKKSFDADLYKQAFEKYEKALEIDPDFLPAYLHWGNSLLQLAAHRDFARTYLAPAEDKLALYYSKGGKAYRVAETFAKYRPCKSLSLQYLGESLKNNETTVPDVKDDSIWVIYKDDVDFLALMAFYRL